MFTVDASAGRYWRVTGLSEFNGTTWGLRDSKLEDAGGLLHPELPTAQVLQQRMTIRRLGGKLIPAAFAPVSISQTDVRWLPNTDTLVSDEDSMQPGDIFNIRSDIADPPAEVLRATTSASPPTNEFFELPPTFPASVAELAHQITDPLPTTYDKALALQTFFRNNFTYDLDVQAGHSNDAIVSFLRIRRGYCEQFAGTFAAMARAVGIPSRVAVGFTPGELQPDGSYHVYGRHAHAWPEVWFDGVGWVLFEPTPGRGAPGHEGTTGVAAAQDDTPAPIGTPGNEPSAPSTTAPLPTQITEPNLDTPVTSAVPGGVGPGGDGGEGGGGTSVWTWFFLGALAIGAWMLAMPNLVKRFTRRGRTPADRVIDAWHGTIGALLLAGAPPQAGATPMEYAVRVEDQLAVDHRSLTELARFVTRAVYSPAGVGEPTAMRAAVLRTQLQETARELTPWYVRLLSRLDPRLVRRSLTG
jgi:transglutaminase-like putative cysteine protease